MSFLLQLCRVKYSEGIYGCEDKLCYGTILKIAVFAPGIV